MNFIEADDGSSDRLPSRTLRSSFLVAETEAELRVLGSSRLSLARWAANFACDLPLPVNNKEHKIVKLSYKVLNVTSCVCI